jgi:hypothetical protein
MALPAQFSLLDSEFNEFLFATVGEERVGMPLSVVSALTRLGLDPWLEAARLSDLPKDSAAATLSGMIARLPLGGWQLADTGRIAARLIDLLPQRGPDIKAADAKAGGEQRAHAPVAIWLVLLGLGAALLLGMASSGALPWGGSHVSRSSPGVQSPG